MGLTLPKDPPSAAAKSLDVVVLPHLPCEISEAHFWQFLGKSNGFPPCSHGLSVDCSHSQSFSVIFNLSVSFNHCHSSRTGEIDCQPEGGEKNA